MATPLYIKIEQYKELVEVLRGIDTKIQEASTVLDKLQQLKQDEDVQLETWANNLDDVKRRADELHETLYQ